MCEVAPDWTYTTRRYETGGRRVVASIGESKVESKKHGVAILSEGECLDLDGDEAKRVAGSHYNQAARHAFICIYSVSASEFQMQMMISK